jgi:hypothetical protein
MLEVRPARLDDFLAFARKQPPVRVKAYAAVEDGEVVAVGGIAFCGDGVFQVFFDVKDAETRRRYPVTLWKNAVRLLHSARSDGILRLVAFPQEGIEEAERFLRRLGFVPSDDASGAFVWE